MQIVDKSHILSSWSHRQFSNWKIWKKKTDKKTGMENDSPRSFVLLFGWNDEHVHWGLFLFKSIGKFLTKFTFDMSKKKN